MFIILSIYIVIETAYLILGKSSIWWWNCLYFMNNAFLTIGVLSTIRGNFDAILIDISMFLAGVNGAYNIITAIDEKFANKVNTCFWVCLIIVGVSNTALVMISEGGGGSTAQTFQTLTSSISITFNITTSRNANLTLAHDAGLTVSNPVNGDIPACLIVTPNSSTDHTLTFPSNYFCNGHSNIFTIEHGTGIVYCFTLRYNGSITIVDYATYSN